MERSRELDSDEQKNAEAEFYAYAARFGLTREEILAQPVIQRKTGGETIQALRDRLSLATAAMRSKRAATFFDNIKARSRLGQGIHDRLEAYAFADGEFSEADLEGMRRHLPIPILFTCTRELTVEAGACLDLTTYAEEWGLSRGEDLATVLNVHRLILKKDGKIQVRGNILVLLCQELINEGGRIEILPTDYSYENAYAGSMNGADGQNGQDAGLPKVTPVLPMLSTFLGRFYEGEPVGPLHGADGISGTDAG